MFNIYIKDIIYLYRLFVIGYLRVLFINHYYYLAFYNKYFKEIR